MHLTAAGEMVRFTWQQLATQYPHAAFDDMVVMPNHMHAVVTLAIPLPGGVASVNPLDGMPSLSDIVGWFKTMSTNAYFRGVRDHCWPRVDRHLWQPSFHDHIVRNDADMQRLREYIAANPARWR